ncbi:hypothetical protein MACJ_001796 [Theileria orientalis]|uniref:Uncharacterized protein n=1 Tax=Theileria orientalis TaxID=68886 RepID=A0A976M6E6_THEOR|nr:hypothetical protein MACJ_001796 [Theileria orientalis]
MYVRRAFRSLLIYLLLCYGKKFTDADEFDKRKRISLSQESITGHSQRSNSHNERSHQQALNVTQASQHCVDSNHQRINSPDVFVEAQNNNHNINNYISSNDHNRSNSQNVERLDGQNFRDSDVDARSISSRSTSSKIQGQNQHVRRPSHDSVRSSSGESETRSQCRRSRKSSFNFLSVDIDSKISSPNIVYQRDEVNNIETYTAICPYLIDMVKMGDVVLWSPKDDNYSDKILIRHDERGNPILRVYYPILDEPVHEPMSGLTVEDATPELPEPLFTIAPTAKFAPISEHLDALSSMGEEDSVKMISLDVNKTFNTSKLIHKVEIDGSQTLTCRTGYQIYKVLEGEEVLWRHQEGEYPNRVIIGMNSRGAKVVDIRFPGDELLVALDVTYTRSTKQIIYMVEADGTESFNCRPGFLISKITKGTKLVWEGKEPPYSDRVVLYYDKNGVKSANVQFFQGYGEPPQIRDESADLETRRQEPIKFVTVDINVKRSSSKIVYIRNERRQRDIYTSISPHLIYKVTNGEKVLWRAKDENYSDKVLIRLDEYGSPILRVYYPRDYDREYEHATAAIIRGIKEELEQAGPPTVGPEEELAFLIIDSRRRDSAELEREGFAKVDKAIGKGVYDVHRLKKRDRDAIEEGLERPADGVLLMYDRKGKPVFKVSYPPDEKPEIVSARRPKFEVPEVTPEKKEKPPAEIVKSKEEEPKVKPEEEKKPAAKPEVEEDQIKIIEGKKEEEKPKEPVALDISLRKTTDEIGFLKQDKFATFMSKGGKVFNSVVSGAQEIWRSKEPEEYSNKVVIDGICLMGKTKNLSVYQMDGKIVHFMSTEHGWRKIDPEIELNINRSSIDHKFEYNVGFADATFTPKSNFIFKGISDGRTMTKVLSWCTPVRKEIYTSTDKAEYSKKVIRDGISCISRIKHVSMYLENGNYKHFYKKSRFHPWREISNQIPLDVNVKDSCYRYEYKVYDMGTYTPRYDFLFKKIYQSSPILKVCGSKLIWNARNEEECANKVVIDGTGASSLPSNVTIYLVNGEIRHFSRPSILSNWREISTEVDLDISKIESTLQIDYTLQGKFQYYVANHDFKITRVIDKKIVVWRGELDNCSKRAMVRGGTTQNKELTLYLPSGPKIFRKQGKNPWKDVTKESSVEMVESKNMDQKKMEQMKMLQEELLKTFTDEKVHLIIEGLKRGYEIAYEVKEEGDDKTYEIKIQYKCVEVRYGPRSLWKYDEDKYGVLHPKKVHYKKDKLLVIVDFEIVGLLFRYGPNEEMKLIYSRRPVPIEIDLEDFEPMEEIHFINKTAYATYEPKQNYSINPLKCGDAKIQDTNDFFSYILKVKAEPARKPKTVYIELVNGKKKQYSKADERTWREVAQY